MNWFEEFLLSISYLELGENKWNILGFAWLISLMGFYAIRYSAHFNNGFFPMPHNRTKKFLWVLVIIILSFGSIYLLQMMLDDFIVTPINLVYGSWELLAPSRGPFTLMKLIGFKWDVYCSIFLYVMFFYILGLWRLFHFTKKSAFLLGLTVAFQFVLASNHIFYFLNLSGYDRLITYWVSYPWFRILTGFFAASIIKKPKLINNESAVDLSK